MSSCRTAFQSERSGYLLRQQWKTFAFVIAMVLAGFRPATAALDPEKALTQYTQSVLGTDAGLPHNSVTAIAQTKDGYLWIGTEEGLARFDGVRFTVFDKENTPGLRSNQISALATDADNTLWIGTAGGGLTRLSAGNFQNFNTKDGLSSDTILSLHKDAQGSLWIGTDGRGLNCFRNHRFQKYGIAEGLLNETIFAISGGKDGTIWVGTHAGISSLENGKVTNYTKKDGLVDDYVKTIHVDGSGVVWIGTNTGGVSCLKNHQLTSYTKENGLASNSIWSIYGDSAGTIWVGTIDGGLSRFRDGRFTNYSTAQGLPFDRIFALFEDSEGDLWIGTGGAGAVVLKDGLFTSTTSREGLTAKVALPVFEDHEGAIWAGTNGGGLNRLKDGRLSRFTTQEGLSGDIVLSIAEDAENNLWVSTRKGLNRIKDGKVKVYNQTSGLPGDIVLCLYTDRAGVLWAGSRGGLSRFDGERFKTFTTADGLSSNYVLSLYADTNNVLWIGTGTGGLNRLKGGRFTSYTTKAGLSSNSVWCILGDPDGTLWVGTSGGGLNRFKNGKFTVYTSREGLLDDQLFQLLSDRNGYLWMSSNKGIARIPKWQLNAFADGNLSALTPETYGASDGLKNRECNGGFQPAGWQARDGRLIFPTMDGIATVDPGKIRKDPMFPTATIEKIGIDGKDFDLSSEIQGKPGKGQLQIEFSAPSLKSPHKIRFRYRLEGFDKEWIEAGERRTAYYTNIPPGNYRFTVTVGTPERLWSTNGASLAIVLAPHFYQTTLFKGLCALLLVGVSVCAYRLRIERLRINEKRLLRLVSERTSALEEQIAAKEQAHAELAEAQKTLIELSRRSGMAEVATGVLHNVGNVLNSVNVGAGIIAGKVRELRLEQVSASVRLLEQNTPNLTEFIAADPKGQRLIPYMNKLSAHLQSEREQVLTEIGALTNHIEHIKQIVAAQQNHAKTSAVTELISLQHLVEDALRLIEISTNDLQVVRDFDDLPKVQAAKHNVLEILVNLLSNAKHAVLDHDCPTRRIRVGLKRTSLERVRIEVQDTGVGIPQENLTRIFAHGFTTKPSGHGFGLHSGALAARQLGGSLWAESQGLGRGATFILELPVSENATTLKKDAA
ncbi:MAG: two-component regulator propeller domain-containing protein [Bryobacteraceae bacterium]